MPNTGVGNAKVRSIQEKITNVLLEFRCAGIVVIPKDRLCGLTGYTSTSTKTWASAFKNTKREGSIEVSNRNGELMVELGMGHLTYPMRNPDRVEALLRKYSKELKIQQTTYDVFDALLGLGRGPYIKKLDLANAVNKNIATKSFINSCKILKSFGILEIRQGIGRGINTSYRLVQSLIRNSDETTSTDAKITIETKTQEYNPTDYTSREIDASTAFQSEEVHVPYAVGNGINPQQSGENLIYHQQQQSEIDAAVAGADNDDDDDCLEPNALSLSQMAGEVVTDEAETRTYEHIFTI
mmetsp:Transcript_23186/g.50668  ORF Transcript_23186/g.50668 Transcript_23186/m.50668 type:complete len:297 (+) Transcript_23186:2716-3606(+)|eukprot:CAMPEP_0168171684 /NCGR_PEP_ID=MMETSP0139_2-20121125/4831_1 /TAXON_ID=44445 /ORGANISM="Pseudo-nitzschia australis, Strain 10249 10 AB" /LENGTH=296 /DNA_ID=CAMNT_0008089243 /DNA_START=975 /DNA_END=1865 /DNA_ORIENTATION=+